MFCKETCNIKTKLALISKRKENHKPLGGTRQEGLISKVQYRSKRLQHVHLRKMRVVSVGHCVQGAYNYILYACKIY